MRHNELHLYETPSMNFLGHPINAFHFVRHVASGWTNVRENVLSDDVIALKEDLGWHNENNLWLITCASYEEPKTMKACPSAKMLSN